MMTRTITGCLTILFTLFIGCTHTRPKGEPLVISFPNLSCHSCETDILNILTTRSGVAEASFRMAWAEVHLRYDPTHTTSEALLSLLKREGYEVLKGPGKGGYLSDASFPSHADVEWLSAQGTDIELEKHLVPTKVTLFDFYSNECNPCKNMDHEMAKILKEHAMIALRKINITDRSSAVSQQFLNKKTSLPHYIIYSPSGKKVDTISGPNIKRLHTAISKAARD